jgi:hypothetical protein
VILSDLHRQHQLTPRPGAIKGAGFSLAMPPLAARRARAVVLLAGGPQMFRHTQGNERLFSALVSVRWGGQKQNVDLHSSQPGWLNFRAVEWLINRPLQTLRMFVSKPIIVVD